MVHAYQLCRYLMLRRPYTRMYIELSVALPIIIQDAVLPKSARWGRAIDKLIPSDQTQIQCQSFLPHAGVCGPFTVPYIRMHVLSKSASTAMWPRCRAAPKNSSQQNIGSAQEENISLRTMLLHCHAHRWQTPGYTVQP